MPLTDDLVFADLGALFEELQRGDEEVLKIADARVRIEPSAEEIPAHAIVLALRLGSLVAEWKKTRKQQKVLQLTHSGFFLFRLRVHSA